MSITRHLLKSACLTLIALLLQACGANYAQKVEENYQATQKRVAALATSLRTGTLRNALIVQSYAEQLQVSKPEFAQIAMALKKDAGLDGALYQNLLRRLSEIKRKPKKEGEYVKAIAELDNLWIAADPLVFNESLIDLANTLADLSQGQLPRIEIPRTATESNKLSGKNVAGSYLVGNPSYGSWSNNSQGQSIWAWYGQYAFFSSLMGGGFYRGSIGYGSWYGNSRYSYYQDYGRSAYGRAADRSAWRTGQKSLRKQGIRTPQRKSYGSVAGQRRVSTYSRSRGTTGTKPKGFGAASRRTSSYSSYSSSSRGSSSRSRGSWGGK